MRSDARKPYPVIDLFAGPGGLGEGFSALQDERDNFCFHSVASIERDDYSHQTLLLRHFLRSFPEGIPDGYHDYLKGKITLADLFLKYPDQFEEATRSALKISLGPENHERVRTIISDRLADKEKWILVGGPPCQAYSLVGRSRMRSNPDFEQDERHFLYKEYLKIIVDHQPPVFVMENVKGLLSSKVAGKPVIDKIVSDLSHPKSAFGNQTNGLSYSLYSLSQAELPTEQIDPKLFLVKAEEYGVPQARHRMFIVGVRSDLNVRPNLLRKHTPPTVAETIGNLPAIRSGLSKGGDSPESWRNEISRLRVDDITSQLNGSPYNRDISSEIRVQMKNLSEFPRERYSTLYPGQPQSNHKVLNTIFDDKLSVLTGHDARSHMSSDIQRYFYASVFAGVTGRSPKLADFPELLLPNHKNVELGRSGKMFSDRFRVQLADSVSTTVTSHISKDGHYFIHYDPMQSRSLTVREAARIQTFPDNYNFVGPRTSQYHQVGNAVPPFLAGQIAEILLELLDAIGGED